MGFFEGKSYFLDVNCIIIICVPILTYWSEFFFKFLITENVSVVTLKLPLFEFPENS